MTLDPVFYARLSRYLPAELLAQLPDHKAITAAVRSLNSIYQAVSSFLPQYVVENEPAYTEDYGDLRPGTFMFADVSGFTALSEKLQKAGGREGVEILTDIINDYFATMLEILAKSNGQLLKFAGDALLTFFPAPSNESEAPLAIRTGLRMQRAMQARFQPIQHPALRELLGEHNLELTMSIGIARGKLFEAVVGNTVQRDHVIQGSLPGQAMRAEEAGQRDDVIVDAALQADYAPMFEMRLIEEGFYQVVDNFGDQLDDYEFVVPRRRRGQVAAVLGLDETDPMDDLRRQLDRTDGIARFVTAEIVNKLAFEGGTITPENRLTTVIFAHVTGFAETLAQWGEAELPRLVAILDRYYSLMQQTISSNGGALTRTDPYRQGIKMLITFGAPVAHADDQERAVTTALEMNRQLDLLNARLLDELPPELHRSPFISQRFGITYGMAFAGQAGWQSRREYTVMGDDVNLAARLMAKSEPGQIWISSRVWEKVHPHFATEELAPLQLKGKAQPVRAYLVKASTVSPLQMSATSGTPFVGRDLQLISLTYALQQAKGPRRVQTFALQGEAGVGKTRMIKQVVEAAQTAGFSAAWANCQRGHGQEQPIWAAILFQLLQLDQAKSEQAQRRLLHVRLDKLGLGELENLFSQYLFGTASEYRIPDQNRSTPRPAARPAVEPKSPAASGGSIFALAETRTALERTGIFGAVREQIGQPPLVSDAQSDTQLYRAVAKRTSLPDGIVRFVQAYANETPTLVIVDDLHRIDPNALEILNKVLGEVKQARLMVMVAHEPTDTLTVNVRRKVSVTDLDENETASLAARFLGVNEIGPRLRVLLWEKTNGRPLFVESLLHLLCQDEQVDLAGQQAELQGDLAAGALPDDVRQLIVSRIDRLPPEARALLQAAAVLGGGFTAETLLALLPGESESQLAERLAGLVQAQIVDQSPDGTYRFRHGLTQATLYESLSRLQRQKMHLAAADYWLNHPAADQHLFSIAYHQVRGGKIMRAMELVFAAAEQAEQSGQLDRAIELYTHALEIFPNDDRARVQLERLGRPPRPA